MLVACLNSLHIRQYNKYYEEVRRIAAMQSGNRQAALDVARKKKPRLLVCAPSNAGVDNVILRIMEDGFVDGKRVAEINKGMQHYVFMSLLLTF